MATEVVMEVAQVEAVEEEQVMEVVVVQPITVMDMDMAMV